MNETGHSDGICSIYVDESADKDKAAECIMDSKTDYPAACNTVEQLLIHTSLSSTLLIDICKALSIKKVVLKCCPTSFSLLKDVIECELAESEDFKTEFMDLVIAVKIVENLIEAIDLVNENGSHHTDCIITESKLNAELFMKSVDSASVYWNASTRFADGFRFAN